MAQATSGITMNSATHMATETEQCQSLHPALLLSLLLAESRVTPKGLSHKTSQLVSGFQVVGIMKSKACFVIDVAPTHFLQCILHGQFLNTSQSRSFLKWVEPTFLLQTVSSQGASSLQQLPCAFSNSNTKIELTLAPFTLTTLLY